jgi:DNA-binding beta-propeller fold protein YncE
LSVVDIDRALAGQPACLGQISVGSFPREINVDIHHGFVYVTNFDSGTLTMIPIHSIERAVTEARAEKTEELR